jgi:hypothetical protein
LRKNDRSLIRATTTIAVILIGILCSALGRAEAEFRQSSETFEKAIRNNSTHTYVVLATIVDDLTGESHTQCIAAPFLLGAIHREYDLSHDAASIEKAIRIALANPTHEFHFSKQAAIDNIPLSGKETGSHLENQRKYQLRLQEACVLIRQEESVFLADITGKVSIDRSK